MAFQEPTLEDKMIAAGILLGGLGAAIGMVFAAQGRTREAYPFMIAGTIVGSVITAGRVLGGDRR